MPLYILHHGELYHYGVKGMKWGVRRTPEQLGHKKVLKKQSKRDIQKRKLMQELASRNEKFSPEAIHGIARTKDGKIVWLETGSDRAGLTHIIKRHGRQFEQEGITRKALPNYLMTALSLGKKIGKQGKDRVIYEFEYKNTRRRVAVNVGSNGFVVGANPTGRIRNK